MRQPSLVQAGTPAPTPEAEEPVYKTERAPSLVSTGTVRGVSGVNLSESIFKPEYWGAYGDYYGTAYRG